MSERWQRELTKLHRAELPADLWDRIVLEGPRLEPLPPPQRSRVAAAVVAFAVFAFAGILLWRALAPAVNTPTLAGPDVLTVPPRGDVAPVFLPDGRPVFVVHHEDGSVSVVDAFSSHRAWGVEELLAWCPSGRNFVEPAHGARFDEYGNYQSIGPAPTGIATFSFDVVERDSSGDPISIRPGAMQPPSPAGSEPVTDPERPPLCGFPDGGFEELVVHELDSAFIWDSPAAAVAAAPEEWITVRGTMLVSSDGFVQLCAEVVGRQCREGAVVRGLDGVGLMVNVTSGPDVTAYEEPGVWLARVRDGVLDDVGRTFLDEA
jgi:hypothetical protein